MKFRKLLNRILAEFDRKDWTHAWCLHCERGYALDDLKYVGNNAGFTCPYDGCDGSFIVDGWNWERMRKLHNYPKAPEWGVRYPQYGREASD